MILALSKEPGQVHNSPMRLLLVDDDPCLVEVLASYLELDRPGWEVRTATDGAGALDHLRAAPVDLVVTDIRMPGLNGMDLLEEVRKDPRLAGVPIILISGLADRDAVRDGMASGADDYLTKPFTGSELVRAIEGRMRRLALRPEAPVEPPAEPPAPELGQITDREREVIALVGRGLATKEIAVRLGLSPHTVSVHRANIMRKLDLHSSAALAALAVRLRLT